MEISSQVFSNEVTSVVGRVWIDAHLREHIKIIGAAHEGLGEVEIHSDVVKSLSHVTPEKMAEFQKADNQISTVYPWVQDEKVPTKSVLCKVRSKTTRKLFYQFDRLILKKGVLLQVYIQEGVEYHQLVLPQQFHSKIL